MKTRRTKQLVLVSTAVATLQLSAPAQAFTEAVHAYLGVETLNHLSPTQGTLSLPYATATPPFTNAQGWDPTKVVSFENYLKPAQSGLGRSEFVRHFLAGVIGPDIFPDRFVGPAFLHSDWSDVGIRNAAKSWEWATELRSHAQAGVAFSSTVLDDAANAWDMTRPYWGNRYQSAAALKSRLQAEAAAFSAGFSAHLVQDAAANEMASAFAGGPYLWTSPVIGLFKGTRRTPLRHDAIQAFVEARLRPWISRAGATLSDLRAPIPFLRETLIRGRLIERTPLAIHLRMFNGLANIYREIFSCDAPRFDEKQCAGQKPPAVFQFIDCIDAPDRKACVRDALCYFAKNAFGHQAARLRDAMDAWLLLALSMGQDRIRDAVQAPRSDTLLDIYKRNLTDYGFGDAVVRARNQPLRGTSPKHLEAHAVVLFVQQFIVPAMTPATVSHTADGKLVATHDPEFLRHIQINCPYMGYTNLVALCDFVRQALDVAARRIAEKVRDLVRDLGRDFLRGIGVDVPEADEMLADRPAAAPPPPSGQASSGGVVFAAVPAARVFFVEDPAVHDRFNRLFPCDKAGPCAQGLVNTQFAPETPTAREIKRRLSRLVGRDAIKGVLASDWSTCRARTDRAATPLEQGISGAQREACFNSAIERALNDGRLTVAHTPVNVSPWMARVRSLSLLALLSPKDLDDLATTKKNLTRFGDPGDLSYTNPFPTSEACAAKLKFKLPVFADSLITLSGRPHRATLLKNRWYDELDWGGFPLYDPLCAPLARTYLPDIPDSDGDGLNDLYDTCPDVDCAPGWIVDPDESHVGGSCRPRGLRPSFIDPAAPTLRSCVAPD